MFFHHRRRSVPSLPNPQHSATTILVAVFSLTLSVVAQSPASNPQPDADPQAQQSQSENKPSTITIPAGTRIALVLTHPVQSRYLHRGDDVYAQINSPVDADNEVVIPVGTFVQGKLDRLSREGGRGVLHLASMSITFPDGYVTPLAGPVTLQTDEGYAQKDPGSRRSFAAFALPLGGAGLGALIGHSVASSRPGTLTNSNPPGCNPSSFGCVSSSVSVPADKGKDTVIGAAVGAGVGMVASLALLFHSHQFYLYAGSPVEMVLPQPISLPQEQVAEAVQQSAAHPEPVQPVVQRPQTPPPPATTDHGTCYTPGTPGTPPTVIPGTPPSGDFPGTPPTIIPGTPPTPGTPYPCP